MATIGALDAFLRRLARSLPGGCVQKLVDWTISCDLRERIEELGGKANRRELAPEEDAEYLEYLDDSEIISLLQAKMRGLNRIVS